VTDQRPARHAPGPPPATEPTFGGQPHGPQCGPGCEHASFGPCVASLSSPADRLAALQEALRTVPEPLVALTHLLHLCRDEHRTLWEGDSDLVSSARTATALARLTALLPAGQTGLQLDAPMRHALADALKPGAGVTPVVLARALALFLDQHYGHTFTESFRSRSPYQPGVGDPVPLTSPDLRSVIRMRPTAPPWRLANRRDETRRIRLAGEWAVGFRVIYDYSLYDTLAGIISADTIVATCHPNSDLSEFAMPADLSRPAFPLAPTDPPGQHATLNRLIGAATAAGASIVVLPELSVTESLARELQHWVRRPGGPRLLVAGSYHHADPLAPSRRRNTAMTWIRGHDGPVTHDKHSPADRPVIEDIQPQGWPELRIYVTCDGWHLVIAICRDLLNPQAVHALTEAGLNLVLVPAMSETLVPFAGPVAQLVGSTQAIVAIANNPADWSTAGRVDGQRPARALFGHPGYGQLTRPVSSPDTDPGVALMTVASGRLRWITTPSTRPRPTAGQPGPGHTPDWARNLAAALTSPPSSAGSLTDPVVLRHAAVLVLLTDSPAGPSVLLTRRAADLGDYPGQWVFPGGACDPGDAGTPATALREAAEEVGLDPCSVEVLGVLSPFAPDSGFLVTPVLAYSATAQSNRSINTAEVATLMTLPLAAWTGSGSPAASVARPGSGCGAREPAGPLQSVATMTGAVLDLLSGRLARTAVPPLSDAGTRHIAPH
jgi:ADP-ribose pyrophosphatase YjhB (NUDIX family)